ncbi:helix-turn-helix domain-containing protein [Nocardia salmonicida]|uniref:helix-turn-helix domain-containing protein n=1 Tax=Nocardia salmonicida TaxID=53431 RepID=UPI0007A4FDAF|nr:helix-turn-helix domain-containing protein [Nocardia salmonicida]
MSKLLNEAEVRKLIPIGHSKYYELIGSGALRSVRIGRRRFVSEQAVADYISGLDEAAAA